MIFRARHPKVAYSVKNGRIVGEVERINTANDPLKVYEGQMRKHFEQEKDVLKAFFKSSRERGSEIEFKGNYRSHSGGLRLESTRKLSFAVKPEEFEINGVELFKSKPPAKLSDQQLRRRLKAFFKKLETGSQTA
jgi:hypothetical protein